MAYDQSFGFVETVGLVAAIEAADAMVKTARVRVKTVANADAALISVICEGDLASCRAAVDAGKAAAARVGDLAGDNLIARPDDDTNYVVAELIGSLRPKAATPPTAAPEKVAPEKAATAKPTAAKPAGRGKKK
ncbi:MAG: BMC domain-containing protein [Desulfovibrionaceae bacterium]|jgi:microcompartment protein CcmL/EutN|nr:BMC domain-containing protein [Desulfovibrionaceae bacterium]